MRWGVVHLYCPICSKPIRYDGNVPTGTYHHTYWGLLCSKACYEAGEMKYARMILGKDDTD